MQPYSLQVLDAALLPVYNVFQVQSIIITATMDAAKVNASVGCRQSVATIRCSFNVCIQSVSSSCNYRNKAKIMQAYNHPNWIQVLYAAFLLPVLDAADLGDNGADGNSLYFYQPKGYVQLKILVVLTTKAVPHNPHT